MSPLALVLVKLTATGWCLGMVIVLWLKQSPLMILICMWLEMVIPTGALRNAYYQPVSYVWPEPVVLILTLAMVVAVW